MSKKAGFKLIVDTGRIDYMNYYPRGNVELLSFWSRSKLRPSDSLTRV